MYQVQYCYRKYCIVALPTKSLLKLQFVPQTISGADLQEWIFTPLGPAYKNARIMKAALEDARGGGAAMAAASQQLPDLTRRVRCSAFNACSALVAATQTKAKFFAMPLEV